MTPLAQWPPPESSHLRAYYPRDASVCSPVPSFHPYDNSFRPFRPTFSTNASLTTPANIELPIFWPYITLTFGATQLSTGKLGLSNGLLVPLKRGHASRGKLPVNTCRMTELRIMGPQNQVGYIQEKPSNSPLESGGVFYPTPKKQPVFHQGDPVLGNGEVEEAHTWHRTRSTQDTEQRTLCGFYMVLIPPPSSCLL